MKGRIKYAVKKDAWKGLSPIEKLQRAAYGELYSSRAASLITMVLDAIKLEHGTFETQYWPGVSNPEDYRIIRKCRHDLAWEKISTVFSKAAESGDGTIFREIAHNLEKSKVPVALEQTYIGMILQQFRLANKPNPTVGQIRKMLGEAKISSSFNMVKRILSYYEEKPTPDKRRRPKKSH